MSSEIKLNTWTWGVVPELHPEAVVKVGGHARDGPQGGCVYLRHMLTEHSRWYAVLSLGPPEMPEEELRLPDGWFIKDDRLHVASPRLHVVCVEYSLPDGSGTGDRHRIVRPTRAECVREINKLLGGER